jgi:hypothetical protein
MLPTVSVSRNERLISHDSYLKVGGPVTGAFLISRG